MTELGCHAIYFLFDNMHPSNMQKALGCFVDGKNVMVEKSQHKVILTTDHLLTECHFTTQWRSHASSLLNCEEIELYDTIARVDLKDKTCLTICLSWKQSASR